MRTPSHTACLSRSDNRTHLLFAPHSPSAPHITLCGQRPGPRPDAVMVVVDCRECRDAREIHA